MSRLLIVRLSLGSVTLFLWAWVVHRIDLGPETGWFVNWSAWSFLHLAAAVVATIGWLYASDEDAFDRADIAETDDFDDWAPEPNARHAATTPAKPWSDERVKARTKVLLVDDEAPIRLMCRVNLEAEGIEVVEAADGLKGLEKAKSEKPDVILLDVMMPDLDGWSVAEQLRESPETRDIPFVFVTPRRAYRDQLHGLGLGAVEYITAPFNPLELAGLVQELLAARARGELEDLRQEKIAKVRALMERDPNGPSD